MITRNEVEFGLDVISAYLRGDRDVSREDVREACLDIRAYWYQCAGELPCPSVAHPWGLDGRASATLDPPY